MTIEWKDADDVVAKVGEAFMIAVFKNSGVGTSLRFGLTGKGSFPNYQVEFNKRPRLLFSGRSHKEWTGDVNHFNDDRISKPPIAYEELLAAFLRQFRSAKGTSAKQ